MSRPDEFVARQIEEVVYYSLAGKYSLDDGSLRAMIRQIISDESSCPASGGEEEIRRSTVEGDVQRQVRTLILLERDWGTRPAADVDLITIHRAVYGTAEDIPRFRSTEFVKDFHGIPPTGLMDVAARREDIDRLLGAVDSLRRDSVKRQASFLARLFSSVIAAHVFEDGNGRAARVGVEYCLRRWGMDLVPIPKVANAPAWKRALHRAIDGDIADLARYIMRLMRGETIEAIELSGA